MTKNDLARLRAWISDTHEYLSGSGERSRSSLDYVLDCALSVFKLAHFHEGDRVVLAALPVGVKGTYAHKHFLRCGLTLGSAGTIREVVFIDGTFRYDLEPDNRLQDVGPYTVRVEERYLERST